MNRISLKTKQDVLSLYLHTAVRRLVLENRIKTEKRENDCYFCITAYLESLKKA